jgi:uncharacterized protein related to proFAR isomerase
MKLVREETKDFGLYDVYERVEGRKSISLLGVLTFYYTSKDAQWVKVENVIETSDDTKLIVQQLTDDKGNHIYTNDVDEIALDGASRILLLMPNMRQLFYDAGFRPKLVSRYAIDLRISKRTSIAEVEVLS